jgi:hypothetical protein
MLPSQSEEEAEALQKLQTLGRRNTTRSQLFAFLFRMFEILVDTFE